MLEQKHSEAPTLVPPVVIEMSDEIEDFRNPFLPRRSNTKPFFDCDEDQEGWNKDAWVDNQQNSKFILKLLEGMGKLPKITERCIIIDGLLFLREDKALKNSKPRVVVPEYLRAFVIGQHHNLELHGHQGRKRTTSMICSRYYWPNMCEDIARWIRSCSACSRRKTTRPMNSGLTTVTLATDSWDTVGIDIVGPLPVTTDGFRWLLTIVDQFSR